MKAESSSEEKTKERRGGEGTSGLQHPLDEVNDVGCQVVKETLQARCLREVRNAD